MKCATLSDAFSRIIDDPISQLWRKGISVEKNATIPSRSSGGAESL